MVESQGKVSEKSENFENDIEWQPCICFCRFNLLKEFHLSFNLKESSKMIHKTLIYLYYNYHS